MGGQHCICRSALSIFVKMAVIYHGDSNQLLLGLIYEWTGNLFVPVTAHFIIDAVFACQIRFEHVRRDIHDEHVESREKKSPESL